jgi:hypothetical protein
MVEHVRYPDDRVRACVFREPGFDFIVEDFIGTDVAAKTGGIHEWQVNCVIGPPDPTKVTQPNALF